MVNFQLLKKQVKQGKPSWKKEGKEEKLVALVILNLRNENSKIVARQNPLSIFSLPWEKEVGIQVQEAVWL
jgi:hypothetical protein